MLAVIYNESNLNLHTLNWLKNQGFLIKYIVTENSELWGKYYIKNIKCISMETFYEKYFIGNVDTILFHSIGEYGVDYVSSMAEILKKRGIKESSMYVIPIELYFNNNPQYEIFTVNEFSYIQHLEFHITNKCNFNCAGCNHMVPLIPKNDDVDIDALLSELSRLKTVFKHISSISILGGEPFMSSRLYEICEQVRTLYPYSVICIYTNGSLLHKVNIDRISFLKNLNIITRVSRYPIYAYNYEDGINNFIKNDGLIMWEHKIGFQKVLHSDKRKFPFHKTTSCQWITLHQGKLYSCCVQAFLKYYNTHFNESFPEVEGVSFSENDIAKDILKKLERPNAICDYCNQYLESIRNDYSQDLEFALKEPNDLRKEDWLSDD